MSTTVDQRVVEMRFDNKNFESNVSTTMSTLDKLKQKLNLTGASKGLEEINASAKKVDMSGLGGAVETVSAKFSALQVMGVTALANITNSAVNAGKRIVSALTIDPVKTGFQEYETQINAVQTILANTQSKGSTIDDVNKALKELNDYADLTIYNFTEMTRNIGTFTAAGIDLETSVNAIQGIANLAAVSGSTSQQASTAMYQLSQALASGTVKLMDWNSVVNAGMGGQIFQDALKKTSELLGTGAEAAIKAEGSFRESLRTGWLTSEVLTETLKTFTTSGANEYVAEYTGLSKEAVEAALEEAKARYGEAEAIEYASKALAAKSGKNEEEIKTALQFAKTAEDAATKVKTFTQLWDVLKEAAQSGWSQTWQLIIGDFEEAKNLLTPLSEALTNIIGKMSDTRNAILESALGKSFASLVKKVNSVTDPIKKSADSIKEVADSVKNYAEVVDDIIGGNWGNGQERWNKLTEAGYDWAHAQNLVNEKLGNAKRHATEYAEAQDKVKESQDEVTESTKTLTDEEKKRIIEMASMMDSGEKSKKLTKEQIEALTELCATADKLGLSVEDFVNNIDEIDGRWLLINSFKNVGKGLLTIIQSIGEAWRKAFHGNASDEEILNKRSEAIFNMIAALHKFSTYLIVDDDAAEKLVRTFKGLFAILDLITTVAGGGLKIAFKVLSSILSYFNLDILDVTASVGDAIVIFRDWFDSIFDISGALDAIIPAITTAFKAIKKWINNVKKLDGVEHLIESISRLFRGLSSIKIGNLGVFDKIVSAFKNLTGIDLTSIGENIFDGLIKGLAGGASKVIDVITEAAANLIDKFCDILGINSPSKVFIAIGGFIIAGLLLGLKEGMISVPESLQGIVDKCLEVIKNIDWGTVFAIGVSIAALAFIKKVGDALEAFSAPFAGLGAIFDETAKAVKSFGKVTKAIAMDIRMKALKNLSVALAILVGSLVVLTYFYTKYNVDMLKAAGIIAGLAVILGVLAFAVGKMSDASVKLGKDGASINGLKTSLLSMAVAIGILALVIKVIGSMSIPEAVQGFIGLVGIMTAMIAFLYVCQKITRSGISKNITNIASLMTRLSIAMLLMAGVCKLVGKLTTKEMIKGAAFAAAFLVFVGLLALVTRSANRNVSRLGSMMIKMAIAMALMVGVCKLVSMLKPEEAIAGAVFALAFVGFVKLLVMATKVGKDDQIAKLGGLLLSISISMLLMVGVCKLVSKLSPEEMLKGAAFAAGFLVFVALLVQITKIDSGQQMAKVAGTILAFAVAVGILAGVSIIMSLMSIEGLIKGVTAVSILGLIMSAMIYASRGANDIKGNLIVMTVAIALMAAAVAGLSFIDPKKLAGATLAMTMLIGIFAVLVNVSKYKSNVNKSIWTLAALVVAVGMLAGVLWLMSTLNVQSALENAAALSVLLLAVSGSMLILNKMELTGSLKKIGLLMAMTAPLILFAIALKQMNGVENAVTNALVLGGLMLAMSGVLAILSLLGLKGLTALAGVASLSALAIPMHLFIEKLKEMNGVANAKNNAIVLGGLMLAMTGVITVLTAIGFLALAAVVGALALCSLVWPMNSFIDILGKMNNVQNASANAELLISLMTAMTGVLTRLAIIGPLALIGVTAMAGLELLMVSLGSIVVLMGALSDKIGPLIDSGLPLMIKLAEGIGKMLGSFISGALTSATQGLPQVGQNLSDFMRNASLFIGGARRIDEDVVNGVKCLSAAIIAIGVAEFISGITSLMTLGKTSFGQLGSDLSDFMEKASGFIEGAKTVDQEVINGAKALAGLVIVLSAAQFLDGVTKIFEKLTGSNDFSALGSKLTSFAGVMVDFSNAINQNGGVNSKAIEEAAKAGTLLVELQKSLPRTGGWIQTVLGKEDLAKFGASCLVFGSSIIAFSNLVVANGGVDDKAVKSAVKAGELMSELQNSLPKTGGWLQTICGEQDLVLFSASCVAFAMCITAFSNTIVSNGGVDSKAIQSAVKAGELMSELQNSLPKTGGAWRTVAGEQDIRNFGLSCVAFGNAMSSFPTVEITEETIESVRKAGTMMMDLYKTLPKTGGWIQTVAGEQDIATFASSCLSFSRAMKNLSALPVISDDTIVSVKKAGTMMIELQSVIPRSGGVLQNIAGEKDIVTFASGCLSFSQAMVNLSNMPVISEEAVSSIKNAGTMLVELQKSIPESKWLDGKMNLEEFSRTINSFRDSLSNLKTVSITEESIQSVINTGTMLIELQKSIPDSKWFDGKMNLEEFSRTINAFTDSLKAFTTNTISEEAVNSAINAGNMIIALQKAIPESKWFDGKVDLEDFGKKIKTFGSYLVEYSNKVSEVDSSIVSSSITNAGRLVTLANRLVGLDTSGIENFKVKSIGSEMKSYANKVADIDPSIVTSSITSAGRLISLIRSLVGIDASGIALFQVKSIGEKMKAYYDSVSGMDMGAISSSISAANRLRNLISSLAGLDTSGVGSFKTAIESLGKIQVGNIANVFKNATNQLVNVGANLITAISRGMNSRRNTLVLTSSSLINLLVNNIRKSAPSFNSAGVLLMSKLISGISSQRIKLLTSIKAPIDLSLNSILGYYDEFYSAGSYLVDGFAAGISENAFRAEAEAVAMAEAALQAARAALGVASPSKEFYKIGGYAGQGFVNALTDYDSISYDSSYDMADYARRGLSDAIRKIQDVMNSDMDAQPTIRPVLDLSDVRSGAAAIGSLFSGGTTMGVYSNVGSISSMMNQRIQNGGNYDVVSAIDGLRKDIGNLSNTTYSINGITYDDGSNISNAVESLVRAAKIERRI